MNHFFTFTLLILSALQVTIYAHHEVKIQPFGNLQGAVHVIPDESIDGINSFIVLRPHVDHNASIKPTPFPWGKVGMSAACTAVVIGVGIGLVMLNDTIKESLYENYYVPIKTDNLWQGDSAWKNEWVHALYRFTEFKVYKDTDFMDMRISRPFSFALPALLYPCYELIKTTASHFLIPRRSRNKARLTVKEIKALPLWVREPIARHFDCKPINLVWYVKELVPALE